ncbi:ABC transporter substrate-binding protein [Paenibacillus sp. ClWae2A]|uniref:ABC transporter substrate-binding protein n=1 Tax=Paenibacillus sp. ClWae2A TaxID=3057177 RepID=UPI0028F62111|nr:ABC transporter substrate-binding protein [Paenibacillus sp. ClWae2A]MDT9721870.1 ABC transporter substrate-binding protein [Paenibacillus sp. ClWae2A]
MIQKMSRLTTLLTLCLVVLVATACGKTADTAANNTTPQNTSQTTTQSEDKGTQVATDAYGNQVEIPIAPKRIVYTDNTVGDLLIFGIKPVGVVQQGLQYATYKDELKDVADIGWPPSPEKIVELQPDLIITSTPDQKQNETLSKIAPVILTNEWDPMPVRIKRLGEWLGNKQVPEEFLAQHSAKIVKMWNELQQDGTIEKDETASVFQYMIGQKRLSVYTTSYLPGFVYNEDGFKPTAAIQKMIDDPDDYGYANISIEQLPEIAGDRIFIVYYSDEELKEVENMTKGPVWSQLPAIKAGKVYFVNGGLGISTDPLAREELIKQLPIMLKK